MFGFKRWIRFFFGFSRTETNGFIVLLLLMTILLLSEPITRMVISSRSVDLSEETAFLDSLNLQWQQRRIIANNNTSTKQTIIQPFGFDPNTASAEAFNKLGFPQTTSARIINYRQKGGKFRTKADLLKIYGLDSTIYHELLPYIQLPTDIRHEIYKYTVSNSRIEKPNLKNIKFDLNLADTAQLNRVYGIGSVLASRIVKYRQGLGGFIDVNQIKEVYGLDSTVSNRLINTSYLEDGYKPQQLNINNADELMLDKHPYINKTLAKAIVVYRFHHGKFSSVEDIRNMQMVKKEIADKIIPYLKIKD